MSFEIKKVPTVEDQKSIYKYTYGPDEAKIFYHGDGSIDYDSTCNEWYLKNTN